MTEDHRPGPCRAPDTSGDHSRSVSRRTRWPSPATRSRCASTPRMPPTTFAADRAGHRADGPDSVRWDAAIELGSTITPHYDPMIAKLIVHAATREAAIARLRDGLDRLLIGGTSPMAVSTAGWSTVPSSERPHHHALPRRDRASRRHGVLEAAAVAATAAGSGPWGAGDRRFTRTDRADRCHARPPRQRS